MVTPSGKKEVVTYLRNQYQLSERRSCYLVGLSRTAYRYIFHRSSDEVLRARLKALAVQYPRYGYLFLHQLLKGECLVVNKKRLIACIKKRIYKSALSNARDYKDRV